MRVFRGKFSILNLIGTILNVSHTRPLRLWSRAKKGARYKVCVNSSPSAALVGRERPFDHALREESLNCSSGLFCKERRVEKKKERFHRVPITTDSRLYASCANVSSREICREWQLCINRYLCTIPVLILAKCEER